MTTYNLPRYFTNNGTLTQLTAGNDALSAGLSAGGGEALAKPLGKILGYGDNPQQYTAEQKETLSNIISLGSATIWATTGNTTDVVSSSVAGSVAVEENKLTKQQASVEWAYALKQCFEQGRSNCSENIKIESISIDPKKPIGYVIKDGNKIIIGDPVHSRKNALTFTTINGHTVLGGNDVALPTIEDIKNYINQAGDFLSAVDDGNTLSGKYGSTMLEHAGLVGDGLTLISSKDLYDFGRNATGVTGGFAGGVVGGIIGTGDSPIFGTGAGIVAGSTIGEEGSKYLYDILFGKPK